MDKNIVDVFAYEEFMEPTQQLAGLLSKIRYIKEGKGLRLYLELEAVIITHYLHYDERPDSPWEDFHTRVKPSLNSGLTDEGQRKHVNDWSGPNAWYPWVFSISAWIMRDGSAPIPCRDEITSSVPVKEDKTEWVDGVDDISLKKYVKNTVVKQLPYDIGFQNIKACWARANEGDFVECIVEAPIDPNTGQLQTDLNQSHVWVQGAKFGEEITVFGTNTKGSDYPITASPALSLLSKYFRIRIDYYKRLIDYPSATSDDDAAGSPGIFIDLDIICQRKRV